LGDWASETLLKRYLWYVSAHMSNICAQGRLDIAPTQWGLEHTQREMNVSASAEGDADLTVKGVDSYD